MIQAQAVPVVSVGGTTRAVIHLGRQVLKLRAGGVKVPWLAKWVLPFSLWSKSPLVFTAPADYLSYATFGPAVTYFRLSEDSPIRQIREAIEKSAGAAQYFGAAFDIGDVDLFNEFAKWVEHETIVSDDGNLVVTLPEMWYADP
jgi:hypothetical protein